MESQKSQGKDLGKIVLVDSRQVHAWLKSLLAKGQEGRFGTAVHGVSRVWNKH